MQRLCGLGRDLADCPRVGNVAREINVSEVNVVGHVA